MMEEHHACQVGKMQSTYERGLRACWSIKSSFRDSTSHMLVTSIGQACNIQSEGYVDVSYEESNGRIVMDSASACFRLLVVFNQGSYI